MQQEIRLVTFGVASVATNLFGLYIWEKHLRGAIRIIAKKIVERGDHNFLMS